ncbi:Crp/Fnr family transcriptional regulator [Aquiflexum sp.]|uniref:Crp/Fnr family transcriptional regulator n=1 Tax=Aquiflexum sp. TaxID=1872584 RepID=UPI0035946954
MNHFGCFNQFHPITPKDYQLLSDKLKPKSFKKGEQLVVPGQIQQELYFVNSGVQMSFFESERKTHVIAFTYPPNICAIPESFSLQLPSQSFLTCLTDSEMDCLDFDTLQNLFDESTAIERLFRKMTEMVLAGVLKRQMELLSKTMEERYVGFCRRSPHLLQLVPHKYIASYLGIDATNFSKLYNQVKF